MSGEIPYGDGQFSTGGSVTEEATRLLAAAQQWLQHTLGEREESRLANGSPECCWCPVCQLIATLRGDRPEVLERLADTQTAVVGLLRALTTAAGATTPGRPAGPSDPAPPAEPATDSPTDSMPAGSMPTGSTPTASSRVQRIELDEDPADSA